MTAYLAPKKRRVPFHFLFLLILFFSPLHLSLIGMQSAHGNIESEIESNGDERPTAEI